MRALVLHPSLKSPGGSSCLTSWALQALRQDFDLTLLSWTEVATGDLNTTYGTTLRPGDFAVELPPPGLRAAFDALPLRLGLLRSGLLQRHARMLDVERRFDLVVSTDDVIDVHRPAVQYVHYPWTYYPRAGDDYEWYHVPPVMRLYRGAIERFCELSTARMAANTTLTNSAWTARRIKDWYGTEPKIVHPPVAVEREELSWSERSDRFAMIGRIAPVKKLIETIAIIEQVRARGHAVSLLICGQRDDRRYERRLRAAAASRPWVELLIDAPRNVTLQRAAACRYGIHAMKREHFGIAWPRWCGWNACASRKPMAVRPRFSAAINGSCSIRPNRRSGKSARCSMIRTPWRVFAPDLPLEPSCSRPSASWPSFLWLAKMPQRATPLRCCPRPRLLV